jgi:hypothetical protein
MSGVYFLCLDGDVVYVGQSIAVGVRVGSHAGSKPCDRIFALPVPPSELDAVEGAFIRILKPRLNMHPGPREDRPDRETLKMIGFEVRGHEVVSPVVSYDSSRKADLSDSAGFKAA